MSGCKLHFCYTSSHFARTSICRFHLPHHFCVCICVGESWAKWKPRGAGHCFPEAWLCDLLQRNWACQLYSCEPKQGYPVVAKEAWPSPQRSNITVMQLTVTALFVRTDSQGGKLAPDQGSELFGYDLWQGNWCVLFHWCYNFPKQIFKPLKPLTFCSGVVQWQTFVRRESDKHTGNNDCRWLRWCW